MQNSDTARKAQEERAHRLMQQIENPSTEPGPSSARDFIEKRMRELNKVEVEKDQREKSGADSGPGA